MSNVIYLILGWLAVALGAIGVLVPLMPTTVFIILAAFFFGKGSPKARQWLMDNRTFGPIIQDWEKNRAIAPKIKLLACSMMFLLLLVSWWYEVNVWLLIVQGVCMVVAATYIITRPNKGL